MLFLVGLGLGSERDITVEALDVVKRAERVYLEAYTSVLIGAAIEDKEGQQQDDGPKGMELQKGKERLEKFYGRQIILADREMVEGSSDEILANAGEVNVAFLVVGDPFGATTHNDLTLRARELGIETRVFHNASIINAVGAAGLSLYNYGQTVSIPLWTDNWKPVSFVSRIQGNRKLGAHTLALLDIKVKEQSEENMARGRRIYEPPRYMDVPTACRQLLESLELLEDQEKDQTDGLPFTEETLVLSCSRLGSSRQTILLASIGTLQRLPSTRFGEPLHSLVILGGQVHPIERDILSKWVVDDNGDSLDQEQIAAKWKSHDAEWHVVQGASSKKQAEDEAEGGSNPIAIGQRRGVSQATRTTQNKNGRPAEVSPRSLGPNSLSPKFSRYNHQNGLSFSPRSESTSQKAAGGSAAGSLSTKNLSASATRAPAFYRGSPNGRSGFVSSSPGTKTIIENMMVSKSGGDVNGKSPKREVGFTTASSLTQGHTKERTIPAERKAEEGQGQPNQAASTQPAGDSKSKSELKAERRAKQEAQRAAKAGVPSTKAKSGPEPKGESVKSRPKGNQREGESRARGGSVSAGTAAETSRHPVDGAAASAKKQAASTTESKYKTTADQTAVREPKTVSLFGHLEHVPSKKAASERFQIHPSIRTLAVQISDFKIVGANARAVALLVAFKKVIRDYSTPVGTSLSRHLMVHLNPQISRLVAARPLGVSMGNAIRYIKYEISVIHIDLPEEDAKELLCEKIDHFIRDRIIMADRLIVEHAVEKIIQNDVILVYARSSVVEATLLDAKARSTDFSVIVIDSGPLHEGKDLLKVLVQAKIPTTLVSIAAIGSIIQRVTKLFLGTAAVFSNGACYARAGTASIALAAKEKGAPVLVLCESYKFSDRVQLDSIVSNEMGKSRTLCSPISPHRLTSRRFSRSLARRRRRSVCRRS